MLAQFILIAAIVQHAATNSQVQLSSTLLQGNLACPGQLVTFTCRIPGGALVLVWRSTEYIGTDLQLELTHEEINHTVHSGAHPTTEAVLVEKNDDNQIVESKLYLVVSSDIPLATVTCENLGHNKSSIPFKLLALPNVIQNMTVLTTTPLPQATSCIVTMQWTAPNNSNDTIINQYIIDYPLGSFSTIDWSIIKARLVLDDCEAQINFTIWAVDVCDREGAKMSSHNNVTERTSTTEHVTFPAVTCGQHSGGVKDCGEYKAAVGIVGTMFGLICCFLLGIITILFFKERRKKLNNVPRTPAQSVCSSDIPEDTDGEVDQETASMFNKDESKEGEKVNNSFTRSLPLTEKLRSTVKVTWRKHLYKYEKLDPSAQDIDDAPPSEEFPV